MAEMRLQRFLSQSGVASRRKCEELITAGRVTVDGKVVTELGTKVDDETARVTVDGRRVMPQSHLWIVLHKPPGTICSTHDPEGRETVLDLVRIPNVRLYPVGRLDYATSGVLLLTNDGLLAEQLLHPRHEIPRTYHVKVKGIVTVPEIEKLREGITLDNGRRATCEAQLLASTGVHTWIEMTIKQGINHQIHHMLAAIDREVLRLIRVEFAGIRADRLAPAKWRSLTQREINELRTAFGLEGETRREPESPGRRQPRIRRNESEAERPAARRASKQAQARRAGDKRAATRRAQEPATKSNDADAAPRRPARKATPARKAAPQAKPARKAAPQAKPARKAAPQAKPARKAAPQAKPARKAAPQAKPARTAAPKAKPARKAPKR